MFYELFISLRYLKAKRRQAFISMITWISIGGVAVGVVALIVVLAVMTGFEIDLRSKILGITSHVVVQKFGDQGMKDYKNVIEQISKIEHVESAAPFIQGQVMLTGGDGHSAGVIIHGIEPVSSGSVIDLEVNMVEGDLSALQEKDPSSNLEGIILGKELFKTFASFIGQEITVISPLGRMTPGGMMPKMKKFRVVGQFRSGMFEYDSNLAFISLKVAQRFFNLRGAAGGIEVKVDDIYLAEQVANKIQSVLKFPHSARSWMQMNKSLFSALQREKVVMFMILSLIVLVAAFNIVSTLIMVVMEKTKEIGVLKSMGATNKSIICIFTIEGMVIGSIGTFLGFLGGITIVKFLGDIELFVERVFNTKVFPSDIYYLDKLPAHISSSDIAVIVSGSILICLIATLYPAWKASKVDPVEALRYE